MGTAIVGRYVLMGPIGYGGVSVVYHAIDTLRGERTAVKLLATEYASDEQARTRVHNEALIARRLRHPSVPRVFGFGDAPLPDGRIVPYVAMELLHGTILSGRLAGGALPWREAIGVAATVADVLAIAHRRGVVHRDLTPENIMVTASGPKIIDFGESVMFAGVSVDARDDSVQRRRVSGGDRPADDVYALGVLLYQMLTGRSPYPDAGPEPQLHAGRLRRMAPTPVLLVPGLPQAAAEICRACMTKRPDDRPDSARVALGLWSLLIAPADPSGAWRRDPAANAPASPSVFDIPVSADGLPTVPASGAAPHLPESGVAATLPGTPASGGPPELAALPGVPASGLAADVPGFGVAAALPGVPASGLAADVPGFGVAAALPGVPHEDLACPTPNAAGPVPDGHPRATERPAPSPAPRGRHSPPEPGGPARRGRPAVWALHPSGAAGGRSTPYSTASG
jgi:serine/threonine-protein kinase